MKAYLGIDPGQRGGLAVVVESGELREHIPMPKTRKGVLAEIAILDAKYKRLVVGVEKAQSMPKQGVVSVANYMREYGVIIGLVMGLGLPYHEIPPAMWKRELFKGQAEKKGKHVAIVLAENLFPDIMLTPGLCRNPQDGIAEAALIAEYCRRLNF